MKTICSILTALTLLLAGGCTQYNGHIGPIFGSWSLISLTEDGEPLEIESETVFSFQNEVVRVTKLVDPPYSVIHRFGNFTLSDDVLALKFQNAPTSTGNYLYTTPNWLYFPLDEPSILLSVSKLTGSEMVLTLDKDGMVYVYSFRKTW